MRVLHILNGLNTGGVESFLLNLSKALKGENITMDFLLRSNENDPEKIKYFENLGGKIYILPSFPKKVINNYLGLKNFFINNGEKYDVIHIHANSLVYFFPIPLASKYCQKAKIVLHSHNTKGMSKLSSMINNINKKRLNNYSVLKIACGSEAGAWMFNGNFTIIPNSIDVSSYKIKSEEKKLLRKKYGVSENDKLISFVGRLEEQKNPFFLLPIVKNLVERNSKIHLIVCGDGSLKKTLEAEINKFDLQHNIHLLGSYQNIPLILKLSDLYVMPSIYEGFSISSIEAQCSGIPVILSDMVPKENVLCKNVYRIGLGQKQWEEKLNELIQENEFCETNFEIIERKGFGLKGLKTNILQIYNN